MGILSSVGINFAIVASDFYKELDLTIFHSDIYLELTDRCACIFELSRLASRLQELFGKLIIAANRRYQRNLGLILT